MASDRPLLYLIDGSNALHRAYHAIRSLSNSRGFPTNAIYGFNAILRKLVREHKPTHVGIAFDSSESAARKEAYPDYKATRKAMDDDLRVQIPYIRRLTEAYRMPILELDRYEADDVLATLACKAADVGFEVVIFTTDKDFFQIVRPHIRVYHPLKERMLDEKGVEEFFGVPPEKVVDVLALMGDASDNVPGVPGIGEVGGRKLILEYGTLENLLANAASVSARKSREALLAHPEQARLSQKLVTLECDLAIDLDPEALRLDPPDDERLRELYSELEFHSLASELESPIEEEAVEFRRLEPGQAPAPLQGRAGVSAVPAAGGVFAAISDGASTAVFEGPAETLLTALDSLQEAISPDAKFLHALYQRAGREPKPRILDPGVARYVLACGTASPEFSAMALDLLRRKAVTEKEEKGDRYLAERAAWSLELHKRLEADLEARPNLKRVFEEIEAPLTPILARMEEAGVLVDVEHLGRLSRRMGEDLARLEAQIHSEAGEEFNVASPLQLSRVLFEKLKLPVGRKTAKTKSHSTGVETLQSLAAQGFKIAQLVMQHREISKLKGTYADSLPALVDERNRVHAKFNQTVAATGRLSSSDPNLQNIPIRTEAGREIRRAFIAPPGTVLLAADYSQIELRILAHVSQDAAMIDAFAQGHDIHRATAAKVFHVDPSLISLEMRIAAKRINFGLLYGMGAFSLAKDLGVTTSEARAFIDAYFAQFPHVRETLDRVVEGAREKGCVTTIFGRERPIPEIHASNGAVRANAERMALNAPFQGSAADIVKIAMIRLDRRLSEAKLSAKMLLQVHDELLFEVPQEELADTREIVVAGMESAAELAVPLRVDAGSGLNWLDAKP